MRSLTNARRSSPIGAYAGRVSAALSATVLALTLAACVAKPEPSPSLDPMLAACELMPVARGVAADLKSAVDAAILDDETAMHEAGNRARAHGSQIIAALNNPSPQPLAGRFETELRSIALFGDQGGLLFADGVPGPQALARLKTSLSTLDQTIDSLRAGFAESGFDSC